MLWQQNTAGNQQQIAFLTMSLRQIGKIHRGHKWSTVIREVVETCSIFTALHAMQTRSNDHNSVCLSVRHVRPSNSCIVTKQKKICPDFYTMQKII